MATYLLLRNNKQQGPVSLQHLIQLGLKPYDLVWVEGKSAAWRYPSEIPELKPYAEVVEEQPFDRFYKRPADRTDTEKPIMAVAEKNKEAVVRQLQQRQTPPKTVPDIVFPSEAASNPEPAQKTTEADPLSLQTSRLMPDIVFPDENSFTDIAMTGLDKKHASYYPKKTVYVTMPVQPKVESKQEAVFNARPGLTTLTGEEPVLLQTKYEQPLDEIKEMYVQKLQERKRQTSKKKLFAETLKKAAVIIAIISAGVLIGFAIKPDNESKEVVIIPATAEPEVNAEKSFVATNAPEPLQQAPAQKETYIEPAVEIPEQKISEQDIQTAREDEIIPVTKTQSQTTSGIKKAIISKQKPAIIEKDEPVITGSAPAIEANPATGERTKKTRQNAVLTHPAESYEKEEGNEIPPVNIGSYVNVSSNNYHVVALGGIRNLQLTVSNDSKYVLDNVTVEVQYVKANQQLLKTESVHFKSVAPNGTLTIRLPDTNRGMKVNFKVVKVESKEFKNDVAGL